MKTVIRLGVVLLLIGVLVGLAIARNPNPLATAPKARAYLPSDVIFGDQTIPLRFVHDKHLAQEVDCETCHEAAESSVSAADLLIPHGFEGEEVCTNCHDLESGEKGEPPSGCSTCHFSSYDPKIPKDKPQFKSDEATVKPALMSIPRPNLKMNHKAHIDKGIKCVRCHGGLEGIQVATRDNALPVMNTCLECHDGKQAPSECRTCHLAKPDGRLVTDFANGKLKPAGHFRNDAHDDNYLRNHADTARGDEQYCSNCHQEKFCLDCHNGVSRPLTIHPNNWIITHPISARRNSPTCTSCHRTQTFCLDCHKRSKVATTIELNPTANAQGFSSKLGAFHPDGWVQGTNGKIDNNVPRGPTHHSFHAQRNIRQCASCHTERTCTNCHSSISHPGSANAINPHGRTFGKSRKCKALRATNRRVCEKCHLIVPECR